MPTVVINALSWLLGHPSDVTNTDARDVGVQLLGYILSIMHWLDELTGHEEDAFKIAQPDFMDGSNGLGNTAYGNAHNWSRLLYVILPNSLHRLDGETHRWVDKKYDGPIAEMNVDINTVTDLANDLNDWRVKTVNPFMHGWNLWYDWFKGWPSSALDLVHGWQRSDSRFVEFTVPKIARPLLNYIGGAGHVRLRDDWLAMLLDGAGNDSEQVMAAVYAVLTSRAS